MKQNNSKRYYMVPAIRVVEMTKNLPVLLAGSNGVFESSRGMSYGGVDTDGIQDPE